MSNGSFTRRCLLLNVYIWELSKGFVALGRWLQLRLGSTGIDWAQMHTRCLEAPVTR